METFIPKSTREIKIVDTFWYVEHLLEVLVGRVDLHGEGRHQVQQQQHFNDDFDLHKKFFLSKLSKMCHL